MSETAVTSFIIRFKQEQAGSPTAPPWRGLIRHIQTNQEIHFTRIEDALGFMVQFVEITGSTGILSASSKRDARAPEIKR